MGTRSICIMLATFNGESHVREQISSIQAQTRSDWVLLISDDGSNDSTLQILQQVAREDSRITLLDNRGESGRGAAGNFGLLMQHALATGSQLFFFSDQDDVWLPDKLEQQSRTFPESGSEDFPMLVHSDMLVVDESLAALHPSVVRYMSLDPCPPEPLSYLLTRNFVTGCALAANRQLLQLASPVPPTAIMHDWWISLVAASCGQIHYIDRPLVKYRQHSTNTIGAKGFWHGLDPRRNWLAGWQDGNREFLATLRQARGLLQQGEKYALWPAGALDKVAAYTEILQGGRIRRICTARELGLRQGNLLLQFILYCRLVLISGASSDSSSIS